MRDTDKPFTVRRVAVLWARLNAEQRRRAAALYIALAAITLPGTGIANDALRVVATTPDLGSIVRTLGGEQIDVTVMAKGTEDPHFVEAKPSLIKQLSQANLFLQIGMDLELGYVPLLLQNARNAAVLPSNPGYLDVSTAVTPLDVPSVPVDRSMGDVHPSGNPHYLLDPVNGIHVARLIADRMIQLRPGERADIDTRYAAFRDTICKSLVGATLAQKYDAEKLALLFERGKLDDFLQQHGDSAALGGWLGLMRPFHGVKVVDDHPMWPYFARRFGLVVAGHLEPKPGIQPTTSHLTEIIGRMKADHIPAILAAPYYDPRHATFVADATGATVVYLAHQVGGRDGTDDYVRMIDFNVTHLAAALSTIRSGS